ncbi:hypothetical protein L2E82_19475 [Cichorium intybus]|uniref:Uncharacterized protein n=1 Tax=Cichorium intybus TaxID=13427 RepID=A0ACB9FBX8_CICIN|nr:hypothetical protein L2E82_19475 [Cichorium intybus]
MNLHYSSLTMEMKIKGDSCAACRYKKHRCALDCPFAPYFPASQPKIFMNVHRLYGSTNVLRILNLLNDNKRKEEAMRSIKYESYIRRVNRVHGCYGAIVYLKNRLAEMTRQLQHIRLLLDTHRRNINQPTQNSLINSLFGSLPVNNEINNQTVGGSSNSATQTIDENDLEAYFVGPIDHKANEVASRIMAPPNNLDNPEITNADLLRILDEYDCVELWREKGREVLGNSYFIPTDCAYRLSRKVVEVCVRLVGSKVGAQGPMADQGGGWKYGEGVFPMESDGGREVGVESVGYVRYLDPRGFRWKMLCNEWPCMVLL